MFCPTIEVLHWNTFREYFGKAITPTSEVRLYYKSIKQWDDKSPMVTSTKFTLRRQGRDLEIVVLSTHLVSCTFQNGDSTIVTSVSNCDLNGEAIVVTKDNSF